MNAAICGNNAKPILFLVAQKLIVSRAERKVYPAYPSASSENETLPCHSRKASGINKGGGGDDQGGCSMRGAAVALLFRSARSARALDKAGLLLKVDIPVNKDTEIHPLMRWQFRGGLDENDRKAMLFTNVVDAKGKRYDIPVVDRRDGSKPEDLSDRDRPSARSAERGVDARDEQSGCAAPRRECAMSGDRHRRRGARSAGRGARCPAGADLDSGLGQRPLSHDLGLHHQGSGNRGAESRQLPRADRKRRAGWA